MKKLIIGFCVLLTLVLASAGLAEEYQIIDTQETGLGGKLVLTETTVQVGDDPLNQFVMHRLVKDIPSHALKGTIFLLPGIGHGFDMYLLDENDNVRKSFAAYFAKRNYDVWGYSPRMHSIHVGDCDSMDCSAMADWGFESMVEDSTFIRSQIEAEHPGENPVIGGLSMGSMLGLAVVNEYPDDYAGVLAWEGSLYTEDEEIQTFDMPACGFFDTLLSYGVFYEEENFPFIKYLAYMSMTDPDGLTTVPDFPPGTTNHQAFLYTQSVPATTSPPAVRPDSVTVAGSVEDDEYLFASEDRLYKVFLGFDDLGITKLNRDIYCGLAGVDTTFYENLGDFTAPVLIIRTGQGYGPIVDDLPNIIGSTEIQVESKEAFGHLDHYLAPFHKLILEHKIRKWMKHTVFD